MGEVINFKDQRVSRRSKKQSQSYYREWFSNEYFYLLTLASWAGRKISVQRTPEGYPKIVDFDPETGEVHQIFIKSNCEVLIFDKNLGNLIGRGATLHDADHEVSVKFRLNHPDLYM